MPPARRSPRRACACACAVGVAVDRRRSPHANTAASTKPLASVIVLSTSSAPVSASAGLADVVRHVRDREGRVGEEGDEERGPVRPERGDEERDADGEEAGAGVADEVLVVRRLGGDDRGRTRGTTRTSVSGPRPPRLR